MLTTKKKLGIKGEQEKDKTGGGGRKQTLIVIRQQVWDFCYENINSSTNLSKPAKIRVDRIPIIQCDLHYHNAAKEQSIREMRGC